MNKLYVLLIIFVIVIIFGVFYNYSQKERFSSGLTSIKVSDFKTAYPVNFNTEKWTTMLEENTKELVLQ